ncbi:estradiol 17 beta-dehydrogenase 5-like [Dendropsophus ebraccatus]|uniref:estradiol 17 beta-dehydrogenase 5-like n=1 Tax=Dendropsophus ebraccatus TaxID=150705 RepID=UPI003831ADE0
MALTPDSRVRLNDGHTMPVLGLGTYTPDEDQKRKAEDSVKLALDVGYRLFDDASFHDNEVAIGRAIRAKIADVKREDVFYTSKVWLTDQSPERVRPSLEKSLRDLQLDYVDLLLIHNPMELKPGEDRFPTAENGKLIYHNTDLWDIWKIPTDQNFSNVVQGLSNNMVSLKGLSGEKMMAEALCSPMLCECHIYLNQSKMLEFCRSHDIALVAYAVLGSSRDVRWIEPNSPYVLQDPVLIEIATKYGRTPAQVAIRHLLQRGIVVLAKSFTASRIQDNFQVFGFQLSDEDMEALNLLDRNMRYITGLVWPDHPKNPFLDEY